MHSFQERIEWIVEYLEKITLDKDLISYYNGRNILVTGGAGAIGSNLIIALSLLVGDKGKIVVLDNFSSIKTKTAWNVSPARNVLMVTGDIRSDFDLKRVFKEDISLVFHLAAFFANQNSVDYPEISADVDVMGLVKILEYSRLAKIERFVYASSGCAIYGSYPKLPLKEDFVSMHLTTPYQINKMTGEMYCNYYSHSYGMKIVNCRFFNSFGPGEVPGQYRNVIPNFIFWAISNIDLPLTGDGSETRDFTYVVDLVQGLIKSGFYESAIGQNFNLAAGREISIKEMAEKVINAVGSKSTIVYRPRRKWDTKPRLLACIDKARDLILYDPVVSFEEGLKTNIKWFLDNWQTINALADFPPGINSAVRN